MKNKNIHLIAFYTQRPRDPKKTHIKGYVTDPANMIWDERIEITRGLTPSDRMYAKIVLDLNEKRTVTNKFNGDLDFKRLFKYFFEGYHQYVTQVMTQLDPEYLTTVVTELQEELDNTPEEIATETENAEAV